MQACNKNMNIKKIIFNTYYEAYLEKELNK